MLRSRAIIKILMIKLVRIAVAFSALLLIVGCGGGGSSDATAESRPKSDPPLYHQKEYDAETGWEQDTSDRKVGSYLESVWHDPASFSSKLVIDSRPAEGAPPPLAAAELARVQVNWLRDYRERSFKRVKLGRQAAIRWAYDAAGEGHFAYFFEKCGTSIVIRGSTSPIAFEPFSEFYGVVASRVKPVCDT
jgi:hypothetical protein